MSSSPSKGAKAPIRVCFVCLGNICRSPTAEATFVRAVKDAGLSDAFVIDSAGTGGWHEGERADARSRAAAARRGIDVTSIARKWRAGDFDRFDYVLAMDRQNRADLVALAPTDAARAKVELFRIHDPGAAPDAEVPDPYYGGEDGFDHVLDLCEAASRGLLATLKKRHDL
ncbi:MAG: low molecular weight protein-tyrosine-phosphatase [Polyangiales bacterium]|nr:low molecular weight phosphotyrosine protein phosphatase [Myxococcales bacterium]